MEEITKETLVSQRIDGGTQVITSNETLVSKTQTVEYLVYFLFAILDISLLFRLVLKFSGASEGSNFVNFIYGFTNIFVWPFEGIFRMIFSQGVETTSVFEPATIIAIIVYGLIAWGIVKFVQIMSGNKQDMLD